MYMLSTFLGKPFTYFIGPTILILLGRQGLFLSKTKNFLLDELGETNTKTQYARSSIAHILFIEGDNWRYPNSNGLTASSSLCTVLIGTFCLYNKNMINLFKVNVHYSLHLKSFLSVSLKNILIQIAAGIRAKDYVTSDLLSLVSCNFFSSLDDFHDLCKIYPNVHVVQSTFQVNLEIFINGFLFCQFFNFLPFPRNPFHSVSPPWHNMSITIHF
ncbi:hypothetical protein ACJX0J_016932 [Zea mays]